MPSPFAQIPRFAIHTGVFPFPGVGMVWSWPGEAGGATDTPLDAMNWFVVAVFMFVFCESLRRERVDTRGVGLTPFVRSYAPLLLSFAILLLWNRTSVARSAQLNYSILPLLHQPLLLSLSTSACVKLKTS